MIRAVAQGARWIVRRPWVSLTSLGCLALGVAACAASWTLIDAAILRPYGLADSRRLVVVWETDPARNQPLIEVSYLNFADWQAQARTVEAMAAFGSQHWPALARIGGEVVPLATRGISTAFFTTLGVAPALGRGFAPGDADPALPPPIVLSHRLWQERFGGSAKLVGQTVFVDGVDHLIVGVMPRGFAYPDDPDAWVSVERVLGEAFQKMPLDQQRQVGILEVLAKRRADASDDDVRGELTAMVRSLQRRHSPKALAATASVAVTPFADEVVGQLGRRLWIALGMSIAVLLLACANVAAARVTHLRERAPELSARMSLGATRGRLARELWFESLPLVLVAAAVSVPLWQAMVAAIASSDAVSGSGVLLTGARGATLALLLVLGAVAWMLAGAWPAVVTARRTATVPHAAGRVVMRTSRVGVPLLLAQAAVAIAVVAVSAAAVQTFYRLSRIDLGFATRGAIIVDFSLPTWKYDGQADVRRAREQLRAALTGLPGVRQVGAVSLRPFRFGEIADGLPVRRSGEALDRPEDATAASRVAVTPTYFDAIGQRLVEGRGFTDFDRQDSEPVVILSRTLARALFGATPAVGQRVDTFSLSETWRSRLVVGVAGDAQYRGLERPSLEVYVPAEQAAAPIGSFVIASDAPLTADTVRTALRRVEPDAAIEGFQTTGELRAAVLSPARLLTTLMGMLGGSVLVLLALGIFGVAAAALRAAWTEIAVRQAVGAMPWQAARAPLRRLTRALCLGLVAGLAAAPLLLSGAGALGLSLSERPFLPLAGAAITVTIAAAAGIVPSLWRAAQSTPAELLRD